MAMLAEPRSKQKWSEDPRNINWSSDKERYGYQMLERMGWASGNGLGRKQNGVTSHVKTKKRKSNLGLGAKESHDQDWISHQEDFNNLLSALHQHGGNAETRTDEQNNKAMLEVAKASRKRVFYKKFIRSKDTSRYSDKDMACIFGSVTSQSAPATPQNLSDEDAQSDDSSASCPPEKTGESGFVTYTSKHNIHEYFARRMKELKEGKTDGNEENKDNEKSSEGSEMNTEDSGETNRKKKKKKKKRKKEEMGELTECNKVENCEGEEAPKKKKKKIENVEEVLDERNEDDLERCPENRKKKKKKRKVENATKVVEVKEDGKCSKVGKCDEIVECNGIGDLKKKKKDKKKGSKLNKTGEVGILANGENYGLNGKKVSKKLDEFLAVKNEVKRTKPKKKKSKK